MFIDWGIWFATPMGAMITTMVTSTIAAAVLIKSFRWFVKVQWVMWYGFLLSFFLMVVMFFLTPTATFTARFDRATQVIVGSNGLTYQQLLSGYFTPTTEAAWLTTLLVAPVALTSLGWVGYAQEQAGEIQGAQSLRNQMFINLGGGLEHPDDGRARDRHGRHGRPAMACGRRGVGRADRALVQQPGHGPHRQPDHPVPDDHRDPAQRTPGGLQRHRRLDAGRRRDVDRRGAPAGGEPREPADPYAGQRPRHLPHPGRVPVRVHLQHGARIHDVHPGRPVGH